MPERRTTAAAATISLLLICGCGKPPQLGNSAQGLKACDALWTAIGARSPTLLQACSEKIVTLSAAGDLTPDVAEYLQGIIHKADDGDWDSARADLKKFIQVQRRAK